MPLLAIVIYAQPSRANQPHNRNWITTIAVDVGDADNEGRERAIYLGARRVVASSVRIELHHAGTIDRLPDGKALHAPEWTDGKVRVWSCPMIGDLAPAARGDDAPTSLSQDGPRYGHRHEEERHR